MKTIIKSLFLTALMAMIVTGCQKNNDDLNVAFKSATVDFDGGTYVYDWASGDAEAECILAGGCGGGSYKIDSGVDAGVFFNEGGVTVTGINKQKFSWTSIYPVCKIIVKAGRGAYIFNIGGELSGTVPYPADLGVKEKDISHITFCFGEPLIVALKLWYWISPTEKNWSASFGSVVPEFTGLWCTNFMGINNFPNSGGIKLIEGLSSTEVGSFTINASGHVVITMAKFNIDQAYVFVGTESELISTIGCTPTGNCGCPLYSTNTLWQSFTAPTNTKVFEFDVNL